MSPDVTRRLEAVVEKVADLVEAGASPDEAIVQAAKSAALAPGHVRLVAQAYNTGRTAVQLAEGSDALEKAAEFDLAHADAIIPRVFPTAEDMAKAAHQRSVAPVYLRPPARPEPTPEWSATIKAAEDVRPDVQADSILGRLRRKVAHALEHLALAADQVRATKVAEELRFVSALGELSDALRDPRSPSLADVRADAAVLFGPVADTVLDHVAAACPDVTKRAAAKVPPPVSWDDPVWRSMGEVLSSARMARLCQVAEVEYLRERDEIKAAEAGLLASLRAPAGDELDELLGHDKQAAWGQDLQRALIYSSVGNAVGRVAGNVTGTQDNFADKRDSLYNSLSTPEHEEELRRIRTGAMLHDLLNNDPVISGHGNPYEVTEVFNEIARTAPRMADQPVAMRALLRRSLQAPLESFDVSELMKMDKTRAELAPHTMAVGPFPDTMNKPKGWQDPEKPKASEKPKTPPAPGS